MKKKFEHKKIEGYIIGNVRLLSFKANAIKGDTLNPEIFKYMYNYT